MAEMFKIVIAGRSDKEGLVIQVSSNSYTLEQVEDEADVMSQEYAPQGFKIYVIPEKLIIDFVKALKDHNQH